MNFVTVLSANNAVKPLDSGITILPCYLSPN